LLFARAFLAAVGAFSAMERDLAGGVAGMTEALMGTGVGVYACWNPLGPLGQLVDGLYDLDEFEQTEQTRQTAVGVSKQNGGQQVKHSKQNWLG